MRGREWRGATDYNLAVINPAASGALSVSLGTWAEVGGEARAVREAVFVAEQGIPVELEWDHWDSGSLHAIARDADGHAIGTGRLLPVDYDPAAPRIAHGGRMAVLSRARQRGIGGMILQRLMAAARERGDTDLVLNVQTYVMSFYASHGFSAQGEVFMEASIEHRRMRAAL